MTLLMSTGLTFGTISSLYGLQRRHHRPDPVLAAGHGGRALGDRPDRDRAALVLARRRAEVADETEPMRPPAEPQPKPSPQESTHERLHLRRTSSLRSTAREGAKALDCALSLVERLGGRLTALAVEGKLPAYAASLGRGRRGQAREGRVLQRVLEGAPERRPGARRQLETDLVPGHAAEVITHYAKAHGHDLIVIGHRGHFLGDYLLGSTADRVAHHAHCPVIVVR